jgi:hypothetical protein
MTLYRRIATLAVLQVLCFLLLSDLESDFFLLHFYQTIVYLALLILLFYFEDRWAYRIGILAPAGWLVLAFATGLRGATTRQLLRLEQEQGLTNLVSFLAAVTMLLSCCDDGSVRPALAHGARGSWQVIDNIRS